MLNSRFFPAGDALRGVVDSIWDADFNDAGAARALTIKVLPTTSPVLIVHYRAAMTAAHRPQYKRTANGMQTRAVTLRPSGRLGVVLVRLRAEEACRVLGCDLAEMTDTGVELSDIFGSRAACRLEEVLAEAGDAEARVTRMRQFLLQKIGPNRLDPVVHQAMLALKRAPAIPIRNLASQLDICERNLQRRFKMVTGISPKRFASVARVEEVVASRLRGCSWASVAHTTGYNDQAHLINDFRSKVGAPPEAFFRNATSAELRNWNAELAASDFYNTFLV